MPLDELAGREGVDSISVRHLLDPSYRMRLRHADKTAFITGGGAGIGRETTLRLAREGARVLVSDVDLAATDVLSIAAKLARSQSDTASWAISSPRSKS